MKVKGKKVSKVVHIVALIGVLTVNIVPSINKAYIIATDIRDEEGIEKVNIGEYQEVKNGTTEEGEISVKSFNINNIGTYTPRTKEITGHATSDYDDGEFRGTLERYVMSGSPADTKTVTGQTSANYNKDGYTGTLTQYLESGLPSDTKHVTGQASENYNKDGYKGTLTQYVASGSYTPSHTKNVTGQTSQYYNSGGYTGTLTQYLAGGSSSSSKYVTNQTSSYYNSGGYSGSLSSYSQLVQSADSKYIDGHTTSNYNSGGYTGTLSQYAYSTGRYPNETRTETATHNNTIMWVYTHNGTSWIPGPKENLSPAPSTKSYSSGGFSGTLYHVRTDRVSDTGNPSLDSSITGYKGLAIPRIVKYTAYYSGTVTKLGSTYTIYRYRGTVTRPAQYATRYQGYVYTADTRYYRYRGDVTRPATDTRQYAYEGNVTRPDTRVYKYEGNVSKPDTRVYGYRGTVYEIDKDAPEITFETDGNIVPNETQSTVVNVRDIYTGVELSQYQWTTSPEFPEEGDWIQFNDGDTISKTESGKLETYYLHITATDKEGNVAISTSNAFAIGRSKPETPQYKLSTEQYTNGNVVVEVYGVREDEVVYYKEGESEWVEYDKPIEITKNTTLTVKSIGLTGEESGEVVIDINNIDKTPPTVVTENLNSDWSTGDVTFDIIATDEDSGVDVNISVNGEQGEMVEDSTGGYKYTYTATYNGEYVFIVKDKGGNETEHTVNVTTIDRDAPEIEVEGNPTEYVEDDEITLTIKASDYGSGVKGITLPDGTVVNQDETNYVVRENGDYKFTVEDNVGNKEEFTIIVDKMMIEYFFYIYDSEGQPLEGAEFVLMRDGEDYATATSDENGLVHFGKVPPTGKYTIRQTKAPEGHIINPEEKDVDVDDDTDPIEIINHPRGKELPATGTIDSVIQVGNVITVGMMVIIMGNKKKRYRNTL